MKQLDEKSMETIAGGRLRLNMYRLQRISGAHRSGAAKPVLDSLADRRDPSA